MTKRNGQTWKRGDRAMLEGVGIVRVAEVVNGGSAAIVYGPANYSGVVRTEDLTELVTSGPETERVA